MSSPISGAGTTTAEHIWSGASPAMSPTQKMSDLFDQIDSSGSGSISQSQFTQAFQTMNPPASFQSAGVSSVWAQLDPNGSGSVSRQDFTNGMTVLMQQLRGHHLGRAASAPDLTRDINQLDSLGGGATGLSGAGSVINVQV